MSALETPRIPRAAVEIDIDQHYISKVYTSGSSITGRAIIKPYRDVGFSNLEILFTGSAATRIDFVQQFPAHSYRTFMKLRMPIYNSDLPQPRIFREGRTYAIPFHFVVPHELTLGACNHKCDNADVHAQHVQPPPTMGFWEGNDQAPEMASIEYAIKVRAYDSCDLGLTKILDGHRFLKVIPARPEQPPLDITPRDERYSLSKTKTIRKNLFSAKLGKVTASALQPAAVMVSPDLVDASTSSARINVTFNPTSTEVTPPKIHSVTGKLVCTTFFSINLVEHLPNLGGRANHLNYPALTYSATTPIFSAQVNTSTWQQQKARVPLERRDSGYSSPQYDEEACESEASEGRGARGSKSKKKKTPPCPIKHTTTLDIPFSLPSASATKKLFLPTFHSCLISRTYTLQLNLTVGPSNTAIALAVPLQIGVDTVNDPLMNEELPSFETAMAQAEEEQADMHLQPRLLQIPQAELHGGSVLPGYDQARGQAISVA